MKAIFLEGGGDSRELHIRCREGFRKLLESCGFKGRLPRLVACGGRNGAFDSFRTAFTRSGKKDFVALWVDSEEPMADIEAAWAHLKTRDNWDKPKGADDEQVLLMATCMETWIVADRAALESHYGKSLQVTALPALQDVETRDRHAVQDSLVKATRKCLNAYAKGKRSFDVLGKLDPATLETHLPSFIRVRRILNGAL